MFTVLKSQGGLAKLSIEEANISSMSLNTLKSRSNDSVAGGFAEVDRLRQLAVQAIESSINTKPTSGVITKNHLKQHTKVQEIVITQLWDEIALMTSLFTESLALAQQFAEKCSDQSELDLFKKRRRELLTMLSLSAKLSDIKRDTAAK